MSVYYAFQVTNKSYAGCQLLSGRIHHAAQKWHLHKKAALTNSIPREAVDLTGLHSQTAHLK